MKKLTVLFLVLVLCLVPSLASCGEDPADTTTEPGATTTAPTVTTAPPSASAAIVAIAGDYQLDGAAYGMPLTWYINIGTDASFKISTKRDFSVDKGNGVVTESNGTFVFVYSDGAANDPKTATFTMVDGNISFSTRVPVGTSGVSSDDFENNPVVALSLAHEELLGEYVGTYEKTSGMGTTLYSYSVVLEAGRKYTFESSFSMMGTTYTFTETGSFTLDGTTFTITPKTQSQMDGSISTLTDATPVAGTLQNGVISAAFKHSNMASSRVECTAQKATTAEVSGIYYAEKTAMGGAMTIEAGLYLDKLGNYEYFCESTSSMGDAAYGEKGTFTYTATEIILTKTHEYDLTADDFVAVTGEVTPVTFTRGTLTVTGTMPTGGMPTELKFYHESIQEVYVAENSAEEASDGIIRNVTLTLNADGSFTLVVKEGETEKVSLAGSFTATKTMGVQLNLTLADESATLIGMVGENGINITNVPVDDLGTEVSFGFERPAPAAE